jgi:hypothetical protein
LQQIVNMGKSKLPIIILAIIIYLASAGISYILFSRTGGVISSKSNAVPPVTSEGKKTNDYEAIEFDPNAAKTEACPLNGVKYGADQKTWWEKHRPLGVMIENSTDARPQSGINAADVTYEAVAEGGITRTLNVFYCQDAGIVGPVRSARTYFVDMISEYGDSPLYAHVGGANTPGPANALGQIGDYGWDGYNDLNQFSIGYPTYKRDESRLGRDVATEHTMYSTTSKLWDVAAKRQLKNVDKNGAAWDTSFRPYVFKDDAPASTSTASTITVPYWGYDGYEVKWTYDKSSNSYARVNGGQVHKDRNTGKQLVTKNIIVLYMRESRANDGYDNNQHMLYGDKGTAKVFMDGKSMNVTWSKATRTARTIIKDANGKEISFNRGKLWFHIVASDAEITAK